MGDAEQKAPNSINQQAEGSKDKAALKAPPSRPTLVPPPRRPERPAAGEAGHSASSSTKQASVNAVTKAPAKPSGTTAKETMTAAAQSDSPPAPEEATIRHQPIAPPSEPMQYRAIGLVRGTYQPEAEDQLNRGRLISDDGCEIDAVLLGRVTSLVKKHIDLSSSHLWVVYPRTRDGDTDLHLQIVGVWEPETLGLPGVSLQEEATASQTEDEDSDSQAEVTGTTDEGLEPTASQHPPEPPAATEEELPEVDDNFFSIRGEVVKYSPEDQVILVKILQGMKRSPKASKAFRLLLHGAIEGRTVGYFWDFKVKREAQSLVLEDASVVGIVPPKKRPKGQSSRKPRTVGRGAPSGSGRRSMPPRPTGIKGSLRPRKSEPSRD